VREDGSQLDHIHSHHHGLSSPCFPLEADRPETFLQTPFLAAGRRMIVISVPRFGIGLVSIEYAVNS
jgi:hypothetical protein